MFPRFRVEGLAHDPTVNSWLKALYRVRLRTEDALRGINPWDAVVDLLREKHNLLIAELTSKRVYLEIGGAKPEQPKTIVMKGRNLITGLPSAVEITSVEVQAVDNTESGATYVNWSPERGGQTIGTLLYSIAANEANYLYVGGLKQNFHEDVEILLRRDPDELKPYLRDQTVKQHWERLDTVRAHLYDAYSDMNLEDFQRTRLGGQIQCSAEWAAYELFQFEAERRADIRNLMSAARKALNPESSET